MTPSTDPHLIAARAKVAEAYPKYVGSLPDGTPLEGVCHRAIVKGAWDEGQLVQGALRGEGCDG